MRSKPTAVTASAASGGRREVSRDGLGERARGDVGRRGDERPRGRLSGDAGADGGGRVEPVLGEVDMNGPAERCRSCRDGRAPRHDAARGGGSARGVAATARWPSPACATASPSSHASGTSVSRPVSPRRRSRTHAVGPSPTTHSTTWAGRSAARGSGSQERSARTATRPHRSTAKPGVTITRPARTLTRSPADTPHVRCAAMWCCARRRAPRSGASRRSPTSSHSPSTCSSRAGDAVMTHLPRCACACRGAS